jgi:D-arabinose 1-dehydrogenase-like Zn-dependent alcohol dehydrogenase
MITRDDLNEEQTSAMPNRRKFIATDLGVAAAPLLSQVAFGATAAGSDEAVGKTPIFVRAWGAASPVGTMEIQRRAVGLAGSVIGGIAETQDVIDYCGARSIKADIELIRPDQINKTFERVINKNIRYRFVIDVKSARA